MYVFCTFQYFIFMCVSEFGPLPCSVATTTRKFFTVLASVIIFGNSLISRQWFGACFVFAGIYSMLTVYLKDLFLVNVAKAVMICLCYLFKIAENNYFNLINDNELLKYIANKLMFSDRFVSWWNVREREKTNTFILWWQKKWWEQKVNRLTVWGAVVGQFGHSKRLFLSSGQSSRCVRRAVPFGGTFLFFVSTHFLAYTYMLLYCRCLWIVSRIFTSFSWFS